MAIFNFPRAVKEIYESNLSMFTTKTLRDIISVDTESVFFKYVSRLVKEKVLIKIERDKYLLSNTKVSDFELANFLVYPSYISFESALNFWGILSQFPYEITSATPKKTKTKQFDKKIFSFSHIDQKIFFGYEKVDNFLIASPEKSLLDQLYLSSKGLKRINLTEIDFSKIKKQKLKDYLKNYPKTNQFSKIINDLSL